MALQQPQCDEEQRQLGADRSADLQQILSQFLLRRTQQVTDPNVEKKKKRKEKETAIRLGFCSRSNFFLSLDLSFVYNFISFEYRNSLPGFLVMAITIGQVVYKSAGLSNGL